MEEEIIKPRVLSPQNNWECDTNVECRGQGSPVGPHAAESYSFKRRWIHLHRALLVRGEEFRLRLPKKTQTAF